MELTIEETLQRAVAAHKVGKLQDAEALYRAILQTQPKHPDANHNLGVLAVSLNKTEAALNLFKIALEANPNQGQFWLSYVDALIKEKQFGNARNVLSQAKRQGLAGEVVDTLEEQLVQLDINLKSQKAEPNKLSKAVDYLETGKYKEAQDWLNKFLEAEPTAAEGWSLLSQLFLLDKKDEEAEKAIATAILINPNLPSVYRNQARLLLKNSKPAEALLKAQSGFEKSTEDPESWIVLAACLGANQRDLEALPLIERALKARPNYAEAFANRALVSLRAKNTTGAIEDFERACELKPHLTQIWELLGTLRYQNRNLSGAIEAFKKAQALEPDNVNRMINLGEFLRQDQRIEEAIAILEEATEKAPENVRAWINLGAALQQGNKIENAKIAYKKALAINPNSAEVCNNLGSIAKDTKDWESARKYYAQAITIKPDLAEAHSNLGIILQELGRLEEAEKSYNKAITIKPDLAEVHSNLGNTLKELGRLEEAETSFKKAIEIKPDLAEAHSNLGITLQELGRIEEGFDSVIKSIGIKPTVVAKNLFIEISKKLNIEIWDCSLSQLVITALIEPWGRPSDVMPFACRLLRVDKEFRNILNQSKDDDCQSNGVESFLGSIFKKEFVASSLLLAMLSSSHIPDAKIEIFLASLRRHLLKVAASVIFNEDETEEVLALYCALAKQCFINDYVYFQTQEEIKRSHQLINKLTKALEDNQSIPAVWVISVACYFPLYSVEGADKLLHQKWSDDVKSVLKQQIEEPVKELDLRASIGTITSIENQVSIAVQRQYEENPYPRWVRLPKNSTKKFLNAYIQSKFPLSPFRRLGDDKNPEILIAGCGTGQHSIGTSQLIKGARILAVDLSMASLAYAKRKTIELDIEFIEYVQADLLKLSPLIRTFDVIESSGVLHHLESPFEGWEVLLSLLRPHGLIKLGLYSELARQDIVRIRNLINKEGIGSTSQEIRDYRKHLLGLNDSIGTRSSDFFNTSACRDLLFHVQEHRMNLKTLADFFENHDLNFLGFDISSSVIRAYKNRFPNDPSATNLDQWHIYEEENPHTFVQMYQFWIQKK
jgi:tetratricopeptide (TPR) repeat protein/SAM-dependent methyltransferase